MCELARVSTKVVIVSWHNPTIPYDSADEKPDNSKFCLIMIIKGFVKKII